MLIAVVAVSCKVALLVGTTADGFTVDSGWWAAIASRGKAVADYCLIEQRGRSSLDWGVGQGWAGTGISLSVRG